MRADHSPRSYLLACDAQLDQRGASPNTLMRRVLLSRTMFFGPFLAFYTILFFVLLAGIFAPFIIATLVIFRAVTKLSIRSAAHVAHSVTR